MWQGVRVWIQALIVMSSLAAEPLEIKDKAGWVSVLPAGFTEIELPSTFKRAFKRGDVTLGFQQLRYPSALDLDGDCLAADAKDKGMTVIREAWRGLTLCGYRSELTRIGKSVITLTVQLPLQPNALNLTIVAPVKDEKAARELLKQVLAATH